MGCIIQFTRKGRKRYRPVFFPKLGFQKITKIGRDKKSFLIHVNSLGEADAGIIWAKALKKKFPDCCICVSVMTTTGKARLEESEFVDQSFYLPWDSYFLLRKVFIYIKPEKIFFIENDVWFNILYMAKKRAIDCFVINGKISEKSLVSYKKYRRIFPVFSYFKKIFVQSDHYVQRFEQLVQRKLISVGGNIKLDLQLEISEEKKENFLKKAGISKEKRIVVWGSTHDTEEQLALDVISSKEWIEYNIQWLIVPRHNERFKKVEQMIKQSGLACNVYSKNKRDLQADILLVDEMGILKTCYAVCHGAIVCGSFTSKVGGHNIFEPCFFKKPFIYGPYMYSQKSFLELSLQYDLGTQTTIENIAEIIKKKLLSYKKQEYQKKCQKFLSEMMSSTDKIIEEVFSDE